MTPLLQTINLKKYFKVGKQFLHAVDGVNFTIEKGKTLGVVGESGCGKTTLGRVILRLLGATDGQILFRGENILDYDRREVKRLRTEMQIIFQDPYSSLNPRLSVSEIIAEPMIVNRIYPHRQQRKAGIEKLIDTVGISKRLLDDYPHELDGGLRQRVGIARALAVKPSFIVCDEPVSALDVSIQAQILNLLMDLQDEMGLTYMFITHDLSVVKHISDDILVMYMGQCVEKAPSKVLYENPIHPYTKALLNAIPLPKMSQRYKEKKVLPGEVTSPINPEMGCRFAARCESASAFCVGQSLPLVEIEKDHFIACARFRDGVQ